VATELTMAQARKNSSARFDPAVEAALRRYGGGVELRGLRRVMVLRSPLPPPVRKALAARRDALMTALLPASAAEAERLVSQLWLAIPARAMGEEGLLAALDVYAVGLAGEPLFAVREACQAVVDRGDRWRPGLPELLALARRAAAGPRWELARVEMALAGEVEVSPSAEERARVMAAMAALRRGLAEGEVAGAVEPSSGASRHPEAARFAAGAPRAGEGEEAA